MSVEIGHPGGSDDRTIWLEMVSDPSPVAKPPYSGTKAVCRSMIYSKLKPVPGGQLLGHAHLDRDDNGNKYSMTASLAMAGKEMFELHNYRQLST